MDGQDMNTLGRQVIKYMPKSKREIKDGFVL